MSEMFKFTGKAYETQYGKEQWRIPVTVVAENETRAREIVSDIFNWKRDYSSTIGYGIDEVEQLPADPAPESEPVQYVPRPVGTSAPIRPMRGRMR